MDLVVSGGRTIVLTTTTLLLIMVAVIPVWHQVQAIWIIEIMLSIIGDIIAVTAEKLNKLGIEKFNFSKFNIVANYYKPGPATQTGNVSYRIGILVMRNNETADFGLWYIADNLVVGNKKLLTDNWDGGVQHFRRRTESSFCKDWNKPWPAMAINQQSAEEAYNSVLENAGATLPKRDAVDIRYC